MVSIFLALLPTVKEIAIGGVTATVAWIASITYAFTLDGETTKAGWDPAVVAALTAGAFMIIAKIADLAWTARRESKRAKEDRKERDTAEHISITETMTEVTAQQLNQLMERRDRLHQKEVDFLKGQILTAEIAKYDVRTRNHLAMDEITRLQAHVLNLHGLLERHEIQFTPLPIKSYMDIMAGVDEKVAAHALTLRELAKDGEA